MITDKQKIKELIPDFIYNKFIDVEVEPERINCYYLTSLEDVMDFDRKPDQVKLEDYYLLLFYDYQDLTEIVIFDLNKLFPNENI